MPYDPNNPTGSAQMAHVGDMKQTHTGVNNSYGGKLPGLKKSKNMISYGVYETKLPALNCAYVGYNEDDPCEFPFKAKITCPEKWLGNSWITCSRAASSVTPLLLTSHAARAPAVWPSHTTPSAH